MRPSLLFSDATSVLSIVALGRSFEAFASSDAVARSAVERWLLRKAALDAAGREGFPSDMGRLTASHAGAPAAPSDRHASRYLDAFEILARTTDRFSADALVDAYKALEADAVHASPEREDALVRTGAEGVLSTIADMEIHDAGELPRLVTASLERRATRMYVLLAPFVFARLLGSPFPVHSDATFRGGDDEGDMGDALARVAKDVTTRLRTISGVRTSYRSLYAEERATSASERVAELSLSWPVMSQRLVERELAMSPRGALTVLTRLSEPGGILDRIPGNAYARRYFVNRAAI